MMLKPEAIRNRIMPYTIPYIAWDMYIDVVGSVIDSLLLLNTGCAVWKRRTLYLFTYVTFIYLPQSFFPLQRSSF